MKLGQLLQMRQQMQNAPLQRQALEQQVQSGQMQLQQEQQAMKDQQSFRAAMSDPSMQGKTIGEVADALAKTGNISQSSWVAARKTDMEQRKALADMTDKQFEIAAKATSANKQLLENVMSLPDDQIQQNWPQIAQQFNAIPGNEKRPLNPAQPLSKDQIQQQGPLLAVHQAYIDADLARRAAQTKQQSEEIGLQGEKNKAQFYQQNGGAPGVPTELMQQADWLKKNPGKGPSDYKLWTMRNSPSAIVMSNQLGGQSNADALDFAAENYRRTGQMPAGFSRSPETTSAIIARAAQLDQQSGGQGIATNKANLQSDIGSLKNLQKFSDSVSAFESTAEKNMNLLQDTAKNIPDLGAKFANTPVRMLNAGMLGTENMAKFQTALNVAQTEAAKVLNNPNSSAVLSDSARKDLQKIIDGNLPYKALVGSLDTLRQDMKNRKESNAEQIKAIQGRIGGTGGSSAPQGGNDPFSQFGGKAH